MYDRHMVNNLGCDGLCIVTAGEKMSRILIVDDDEKVRLVIKSYAESAGYLTDEASDGASAVKMIMTNTYDLVTMDIVMPVRDGFKACEQIRRFSRIPIIIVSERSGTQDRIRGFELGADDYVTKPFSPRELVLRIKAVLSRMGDKKDATTGHHKYIDGGLTVDFSARTVMIDGKNVNLTPREYELLFYLVRNRGLALTRDKLLTAVWGCDYYGDERTLDTHIKKLRKALAEYGSRIVTLRGVGYKFETKGQD